MARLYQYADSNEKSGLYLLDGYKGQHTTFQVSQLAQKLLYFLDFSPGIRNQNTGPRIPDELHWGLFEIGWVYTNESDFSPPTNNAGEIVIEGEKVELSDDVINQLEEFVSSKNNIGEVAELADILDLDMASGRQSHQNSANENENGLNVTFPDPEDVEPLTVDRIIKSMKKVDGVDNKIAGRMLNQLQRDGIIDDEI